MVSTSMMKSFAKISILILASIIACNIQTALGHGHMYHPAPWHATNDCSPNGSPFDCDYLHQVPNHWNEDRCFVEEDNYEKVCSFSADKNAWFTNYTMISGEPTLEPEDMYDQFHNGKKNKKMPWSSPGSAPIFGDGCGVNGGNPNGCIGMPFIFGTCCGGCYKNGKCGCGGYVGGKSAQEHYKEGLFVGAPTTVWKRHLLAKQPLNSKQSAKGGEPAEVMWNSGMGHRGGYAYRLCQVNNGEPWKVNEKCFQNGHLNFHGDTTWIYDAPFPGGFNPENWIAQPKKTTRIGTTPPGSEWAKVNLPRKDAKKDEWAIKDLVDVPENLAPGQYVLSFRWDSQRTPQVWNACANIEIV